MRPCRLALVGLLAAVLAAFAATAAAPARAATLQSDRQRAKVLAAQVSALDARIDAAVQRYAQAGKALAAVRRQIHDTKLERRSAQRELQLAKAQLAARAVALYKHDTVTPLDAVFAADDFSELVGQLATVQHVTSSDEDMVRTIRQTTRRLADQATLLAADERTAEKLVAKRSDELGAIREELGRRRALLAGVRAEIRQLAAASRPAKSASAATVEPPSSGGGEWQWWPQIQAAAGANGVSARGLYRLMMIESGGVATAANAGGYYGLFQYSTGTWEGDWNPYRAADICDGAAQIRATALAIHLGHGPSWWGASYAWAFEGC